MLLSLLSKGIFVLDVRPAAGRLICRYDVFMEAQGTLEWCHYMAAGNPRNLVWFTAFNRILPHESPMTATEWTAWLRSRLSGRYSESSLTKHLREEVRFVTDAYLHRNFKKLRISHQASDERLYRPRGTSLVLEILAAMLYDLGTRRQSELQQVDALMTGAGAPGLLFGLEKTALREMIEHRHRLHA